MRIKLNCFSKESLNRLILLILSIMPTVTLIKASDTNFLKIVLIIQLVLLSIMMAVNFRAITRKETTILILNLFSIIMTLSFHSAFGSALMFINALLCFKIFNNIIIEKKEFIKIHLINGVLLSTYVFLIERPIYSGNTIPDAFNNRINTNLIAILFLCAFLHLACCIVTITEKNRYRLPLLIILGIIYGENIWFYEARSAMISMIIFVASIIIFQKSIPYKKYKKICIIVLTISLVLPFVYNGLINAIGISTIFGKGIGTREIVWANCINVIKQYPIFGNGNDTLVVINSGGGLTPSMHNTLLSIWKILGIVPTITFLLLCIQHDNSEYDEKRYIYAQIAFISTLPVCFFESFYTEELLYMAYLPFLITNIKDNNQLKDGNEDEKDNSLLLVRKKS